MFDDVRLPADNVLGEAGHGRRLVETINAYGAAAKCAEMIGGAQRVLEMTLQYAREREQFGQPIGSFQAVQHQCADMAADIDGARLIAYESIWRLSEGADWMLNVSVAKSWVSDAYRRVILRAHQVHGAIGFTKEHDLQLYTRRAKAAELAFGDAHYHRELLARQLGL
jgi:alkylation response protein AidB-like acyl-CoA dehydrogenase